MQGTVAFYMCHYGSDSNYQYGQVVAAIWFKNITLNLLYFFLRNNYCGSVDGQNQEFLKTDMIK